MTFTAIVHIMPRTEILDPQGKATEAGLHNLGFPFANVRVGKRIQLEVDAADKDAAKAQVTEASKKLLVNTITEQFTVEIL